MHWRTLKQCDPLGSGSAPLICLDGQVFRPLLCIRWLGYWLASDLSSSQHFTRRLALAQVAFATVKRLSPSGSGLSPHVVHRLAVALLLSILLYGADLLVPSKGMYSKMEVFWRQVLRWLSNCFRSTPIPILAAEASLPPITAIVPLKRTMTALRLACASPTQNPAAARLSPDFPSLLAYWAPDLYRSLCTGTRLPLNIMPLSWRTQHPPSKARSHLPVDQLTNTASPVLGFLSRAPLANRHLLTDSSRLPSTDVMRATSQALQGRARSLLKVDWERLSPTPSYYTYLLSITPHLFMGLGKFMAGRIYQMRA